MPQKRLMRERYVRWIAVVVSKWHGFGANSRETREIEGLARVFVREGMGRWEAVRAAAVLVLKKYAKQAA